MFDHTAGIAGTGTSGGGTGASAGATQVWDEMWDTPELIWTNGMRAELRAALHVLLVPANATYTGTSSSSSCSSSSSSSGSYIPAGLQPCLACKVPQLSSNYTICYTRLKNEVHIGGVYLRSFLRQPTCRLSHPVYTLEKMVEVWDDWRAVAVF
jgi:hypothetical protein